MACFEMLLPSLSTKINILGQVNDFWTCVIGEGYLLDSSDWMSFENTNNNIIWPSGIGRLPDNVISTPYLLRAIV